MLTCINRKPSVQTRERAPLAAIQEQIRS